MVTELLCIIGLIEMSLVCAVWRTVSIKFFRPQTEFLTWARCVNFTPFSTKNSMKMWFFPEDKPVNLYDKEFSMDKHICRHYNSRRNLGRFSAINPCVIQRVHSQFNNHHCRRLSTDTDINRKSSIITMFPEKIQPYLVLARLDRPIGYWILYLPGAWSISLAAEAGSLPNLNLLTLFFVGSILMRSAGCTINDMWDSDLDKKVARTSSRPLAGGEITYFQALVFLGSQLSIALGILLSLNLYSIMLGASSLVLVVTYPLMKRITFWPQLFLGVTFNWSCLVGWTAVTGYLEWSVCLPLYAAGVSWTVFYDTIYAFQDVEDDERVGIKSTALLFGDQSKTFLTVLSAIMMANLLAVGINTSQTWPFYFGLIGVTSHLAWQMVQVDLSQPKDCLSKFKSNKWLGLLLWLSIVMGTLLKPKDEKVEEIIN